jgi:hypothetical protein
LRIERNTFETLNAVAVERLDRAHEWLRKHWWCTQMRGDLGPGRCY